MKKIFYFSRSKNFFFISIVFVLFFGMTQQISAASLLFTSSMPNDRMAIHEQFRVTLKLDTQGSVINALEAHIVYPHDMLRLVGIESGTSFLNMWLESPHERDGAVVLSGVAPGGFNGVINALEYPKVSPGDVVTLIFDPLQSGSATISATTSSAFLNDGLGSPVPLTYQPITVTVANYVNQTSVSNNDVTPPDFVYAEAHYDDTLGGMSLFFAATDKDSGVERYEVQENGLWKVVQSPYLINQNGGVYYIKVIDRVGNERIKEVQVPFSSREAPSSMLWTLLLLSLLVIFYVAYRLIRKWLKKYKRS